MGMGIMAYECVSQEAVDLAVRTVQHLLADTPADILERLVAAKSQIAIIGCKQVSFELAVLGCTKHVVAFCLPPQQVCMVSMAVA